MDSAQPWANRLRQRGNSGKAAETSTTVQQGSIASSENVTRKNKAAKRAGKGSQSARPAGNPARASSRKRKANNLDNDSVHRDGERESKRTCSQEPLPTTPTLETRRTERPRTAQKQRDKRNLTISPSTTVQIVNLLPTPSLTDARFGRMTGPIADLPNSVSPIEVESLTSQSLVTIDSTTSSLLSPPLSNQGNSQLPEIANISVGENSRIERPFHSAPATTSSFEESFLRHTAEQSQAPPTLKPAFKYVRTRTSRGSQPPATEELSPVGRILEYPRPENVAEVLEVDPLLTLAEFSDLDLHEIVSGLFLGSFSVLMPSNIEKFRCLGIRRIFTICPRLELTENRDKEADEMIDNDADFIRTRIEIVDHPSVDLLQHLPDIVQELDAIIESREQVYVHCRMGRSRSVAVVAAYLMKKKQINFEKAYELIRNKGREININFGFHQQLLIWDLIKEDWDNRETYAEYRYWRMANDAGIVSHYHYGYQTRSINLTSREPNRRTMMEFTETFPIPQDEANLVTAIRKFPDLQKPDDSWYRCCRCEYPLAPGNATFSFSNSHGENPRCTHRFLCNPLSWMEGQIDTDSPGGKLSCPNCSNNPEHVGEYCWFGLQCSCGEIVSPGLALLSILADGHLRGVEFRPVREGSVDNDEVESSQETESQDEDVDDVDEDDFDSLSESHESREEDIDDEEIVGPTEEMLSESEEANAGVEQITLESDVIPGSQDVDWLTFPAEIHQPGGTQKAETVKQDVRMIPRSVPTMDHLPPSMRNPHHLPIMPSRLRNTWKPPSRSSSSGDSQASELSKSSNVNDNDNVVMDEPGEINWGSVEISELDEIDFQTFMEELANAQHS